MMGHTHMAFGIFFFSLFASFLDIQLSPLLIALICLGSLLPDIDHEQSILGTILFPISSYLSKKYGHRTITHSLFFLGIISLIAMPLALFNWHYVFAICIGVLSHLISDGFNVSGVPLLYPNTTPFYFLPEKLLVKVGTSAEFLYFILFCLLCAFSLGIGYIGFRTLFHFILPSFSGAVYDYSHDCEGTGIRKLCYVEAYSCDEYCGEVNGLATGLHDGRLVIRTEDKQYIELSRTYTRKLKLNYADDVNISYKYKEFDNEPFILERLPRYTSVSGILETSQGHIEFHSVLVSDINLRCTVERGWIEYKIREELR